MQPPPPASRHEGHLLSGNVFTIALHNIAIVKL